MIQRSFTLITIILVILSSCSMSQEKQIQQAVEYQIKYYPASRLTDIYKNFFQDFYGPGHLLSNPDGALKYLKREVEEVDSCTLHKQVEGTGYKNNFVRVDLCVIRKGEISYDEFVQLFVESVESFSLPEIEAWKAEWEKIVGVIEDMDLEIAGFGEDKKKIRELLSKGEYVVHHSPEYIEAYHPHYRIIKKELIQKYLQYKD